MSVIMCMLLSCFFAYTAGACAQGMNQRQYGWRKDLIVLFFLIASWYFSIAMLGYATKG